MTSDPELAQLEARLQRRRSGFARYLKFRAGVGVVLAVCGLALAAFAVALVLVAVGALDIPVLARWTGGFDVVLATFMPAALAFICLRTGLNYWRHRVPDDDDTGCLAG